MRRLVVLQAIVIVVSLVAEAYEHETIIGSGAIFSMVGLAIVVTAFRKRDHAAVMFGGSAIVFASFIVFLINFNAWTPAQGNYPITILSLTYAAFALPASVSLALKRRQSEDSDRLHSGVDRGSEGLAESHYADR
ncbi:hypothetical protein [Rubripirellula lacrimiformis]|uniref:hypothetical protein n=1 Tax=Rubripirellula lacrimiformis TaxID=1930273 RepID=UPI00119DEA06|nr:hypothetical protein [Rubripirellula lacrimiformis]